jgi:hypothetical protein
MKRRHVAWGKGVRIRTTIEEDACHVDLSGDRRVVKRGHSAFVTAVDRIASIEALPDGGDVSLLCRSMKSSGCRLRIEGLGRGGEGGSV